MNDALAIYRNGNCDVTLLADGTKMVEYDPPAAPEFPLAIDLKITDKCDRSCPWCHENSTPTGRQANRRFILDLTAELPAGTELAIGGGDPCLFSHLPDLLETLSKRGLIVNMTVNAAHVRRHADMIRYFRSRGWLHGLGISWNEECAPGVASVRDSNTVLHVIVGVNDLPQVLRLVREGIKVLILGYKRYGRGATYDGVPEGEIAKWREFARDILQPRAHIAFDTLALQQLGIRELVHEEVWEQHYMGDDGQLTMYVDAVAREYASSSTSTRTPIGRRSIRDIFRDVRLAAAAGIVS